LTACGVEHALERVNVRPPPFALHALERGIVGKIDPWLHADRPRLSLDGHFGKRDGRVRDELERTCEVIVPVERVEDDPVDVVRLDVAGRLRIESRLRGRKRHAQHLVGIRLRRCPRDCAKRDREAQQGARKRAVHGTLQQLFDVTGETRRLRVGSVTLDDVAVTIDEE
jgi:hypothetical protein